MSPRETSTDVQYLYLVGRLYPDNRLELLPTFLTNDPQNVKEDRESPLRAELYDAARMLLLRFHIPVGTYCGDGTPIPELPVRGKIPFPSATSVIQFYREEVLIHEIQVSASGPEVRLTWEPADTMSGKQTITWKASHPEGKAMQFFLRYSHTDGASWQLASFPAEGNQQEIDFDQFPGGVRCRIMVVATDGVRTETAPSRSFVVSVRPCQAMILAPQDGSEFVIGQSVLFQGQGYYLEEKQAETENLVWASSQDGELGQGMMVEVKGLSPGLHQITFSAGVRGRVGEASISISVGGETHQQWMLS